MIRRNCKICNISMLRGECMQVRSFTNDDGNFYDICKHCSYNISSDITLIQSLAESIRKEERIEKQKQIRNDTIDEILKDDD